jgi:hypothetical protein
VQGCGCIKERFVVEGQINTSVWEGFYGNKPDAGCFDGYLGAFPFFSIICMNNEIQFEIDVLS